MDGTDMHAAMCSVRTRPWDSAADFQKCQATGSRMSRHVCSAWCAAVLWTIRPSSASPRRDRELPMRFVALIFDSAVMRGVRVRSFAVKIYFREFLRVQHNFPVRFSVWRAVRGSGSLNLIENHTNRDYSICTMSSIVIWCVNCDFSLFCLFFLCRHSANRLRVLLTSCQHMCH